MLKRGLLKAGGLVVLGALIGRALLMPRPREISLKERLAVFPTRGLPLDRSVTIRWDDQQIPFIEAERDRDAAFALGLVHAHLRLGQMAIYKRIAQGRIAEMGGPLAIDIDRGLRILDFGRAARAIEASLPDATRTWLTRFVEGINYYQSRVARLPIEYAILGLKREPWTVTDILAFGRLAGADINWLLWFNLLRLRPRKDWPEIWGRLLGADRDVGAGIDDRRGTRAHTADRTGLPRPGSNCLAVGASRSLTGAAVLAGDTHLGVGLPNSWLLAGLRSPSYHVVGMMIPGVPVFGIGRNPWIAWGGTNMRAAASDLYDLSRLPEEQIVARRESIGVRWSPQSNVFVREAPWGPIVSDAPQLQNLSTPPLALRWTGHLPSDEITALLAVSRARSFAEFRAGLESFALPGQNMLYADIDGNIGQVMAVHLPARSTAPPTDLILDPETAAMAWQNMRASADLPYVLNPQRGFLVSGNNRPAEADIPIGHFFSPDDRVQRMAALLGGSGVIAVADIEVLQQDVYAASAVVLRDLFVERMETLGVATRATVRERALIDLLKQWDGYYHTHSRGALAFELFRCAFTETFYAYSLGTQDWAAWASADRIQSLAIEEIDKANASDLARCLKEAVRKAARDMDAFADWGDMHRLALNHPLGVLPLAGRRFRFGEHAIGGANETLMNTAHGDTRKRHTVNYGSNARYICDLSHPDRNSFVLLGGQDGWLNSSTFIDQVPLWLKGGYIELPLQPQAVRASFLHEMELSP